MGNSQTNEKQSKTGKSPAKGKHFIRNLNRKTVGRESKKRKKSDSKRDAIDRTPDSEYNDNEDRVSDNDAFECVFKTVSREEVEPQHEHGPEHDEVTGRCARSATPEASADSVSSVPRTPSAVELNQCYYSSIDSDQNTMPQNNANSSLSPINLQKEVLDILDNDNYKDKNEGFDDSYTKGDDEKVMGALFSGLRRGEQLERSTHECKHEFRENRLKACPGTTSFTAVSRHRRAEQSPSCDPSPGPYDNELTEREKRRLSSLSDMPMESNVLRKVASLTLEQNEPKVTRPKFVPEKLDFQLYEKFEGQMLLNWFLSSVSENTHLKTLLSTQDLKNLGIQYCTHLLAAGVLRQISDKNAPTEKIFKPSLMYYWAHMEAPASQPVTPGRLHLSAWPPDKASSAESITSPSILENYTNLIQNNNEEITDINQAKSLISQLKTRLQELEFQLEKHKITSQIELLNKNIENFDLSSSTTRKNNVYLISKEVQTDDANDTATLLNTVINKPNSVSVGTLGTNVNSIGLSGDCRNNGEDKQSEPEARSDKLENYCKLNKSRDSNKSPGKDAIMQTSNQEINKSQKADFTHQHDEIPVSRSTHCDISSDESFQSTTSTEITSTELNSAPDLNRRVDLSLKSIPTAATQVLFVVKKHCATPSSSLTSANVTPEYGSPRRSDAECRSLGSPRTSAGGTPAKDSMSKLPSDGSSAEYTSLPSLPPPMPGAPPSPPPVPGTNLSHPGRTQCEPTGLVPLSPSMPPPPPPMPCIGPPPPPMPEMGPPPPPMPGIGPPPPPMPGMGPPPPPMPGIGPPPPPMPGMGPPPPPMPGIGPPPPPMPGMGPPPPPMPGMGPPPPPMPGINPPPPPMPGMGPLPPPMAMSGPPPPPGPPSGPIPFPAPPVGGWNLQRAALRKTAVIPAAPMRPLYWTRIITPPATPAYQAGTDTVKPLWLEIDEAPLDNIDEFTDLFSRQVIQAPLKKNQKPTVSTKVKVQPVKILDSKRSQNTGILAQSLHVEFSEIENAIYNFDTSVVSLEALKQMYELRATEEELAQIREHLRTQPDVPLDRPEAFLYDLAGISNFAERLSCFMFQAEFDDAISTTMHKLDNLKHTCEFLMSSENLKRLFAIILTLGNYMNGGNGQRGQADGFGLEILAKLKDVKSKQSNITLLHFIVRTYMRQCGGALSEECAMPAPEPGDVARAAAVDFADVAAQLASLRKQHAACREKSKKVIEGDVKAQTPSDETDQSEIRRKRLEVFRDKMITFLNAAEEKLKAESENLEECRSKFIATVRFYQYTPKCGKVEECDPKEFFALWTSFCSDVKDIYKKEEQLAIKEKLRETKKLAEERKSSTQTKPKREGGLKARLQKLSSTRKS